MSRLDIKLEIIDKFRKAMKERIESISSEGKPIVHQVYLLSHPACDACIDVIKEIKEQIDNNDIIVLDVKTPLGKKALQDIKEDKIPEFVVYVNGRFLKASEFQEEVSSEKERTS